MSLEYFNSQLKKLKLSPVLHVEGQDVLFSETIEDIPTWERIFITFDQTFSMFKMATGNHWVTSFKNSSESDKLHALMNSEQVWFPVENFADFMEVVYEHIREDIKWNGKQHNSYKKVSQSKNNLRTIFSLLGADRISGLSSFRGEHYWKYLGYSLTVPQLIVAQESKVSKAERDIMIFKSIPLSWLSTINAEQVNNFIVINPPPEEIENMSQLPVAWALKLFSVDSE